MKQKFNNQTAEFYTRYDRGRIIKNQARKRKEIIYGAQAVKAQIGIAGRETEDYDILSKTPKKSAIDIKNKLNKSAQQKVYYYTPSKFHKGTHKVYHIGNDMKKGTQDDVGVVDYSKLEKKPRTVIINGVRYVHTSETVKDKKKSLSDKNYAFRHQKDREDLNRIQNYNSFGKFIKKVTSKWRK